MTAEELRQRLYAYVLKRAGGSFQFAELLIELRSQPKTAIPEEERQTLQALLHDLYLRGLIVPSIYETFGGFGPTWQVTTMGSLSLQADDLLAVDPVGFVRGARLSAGELPELCFTYLADAVACFDNHLVRPAAVMLGVAAEIAALELAEEIMRVCAPQKLNEWLASKRAFAFRFSEARRAAESRGLWQRIRAAIPAQDDASALFRSDIDRIEDQLGTLLTVIRLQRNDAGHAGPITADSNAIRAFIAVFPTMAASISRLLALVAAQDLGEV